MENIKVTSSCKTFGNGVRWVEGRDTNRQLFHTMGSVNKQPLLSNESIYKSLGEKVASFTDRNLAISNRGIASVKTVPTLAKPVWIIDGNNMEHISRPKTEPPQLQQLHNPPPLCSKPNFYNGEVANNIVSLPEKCNQLDTSRKSDLAEWEEKQIKSLDYSTGRTEVLVTDEKFSSCHALHRTRGHHRDRSLSQRHELGRCHALSESVIGSRPNQTQSVLGLAHLLNEPMKKDSFRFYTFLLPKIRPPPRNQSASRTPPTSEFLPQNVSKKRQHPRGMVSKDKLTSEQSTKPNVPKHRMPKENKSKDISSVGQQQTVSGLKEKSKQAPSSKNPSITQEKTYSNILSNSLISKESTRKTNTRQLHSDIATVSQPTGGQKLKQCSTKQKPKCRPMRNHPGRQSARKKPIPGNRSRKQISYQLTSRETPNVGVSPCNFAKGSTKYQYVIETGRLPDRDVNSVPASRGSSQGYDSGGLYCSAENVSKNRRVVRRATKRATDPKRSVKKKVSENLSSTEPPTRSRPRINKQRRKLQRSTTSNRSSKESTSQVHLYSSSELHPKNQCILAGLVSSKKRSYSNRSSRESTTKDRCDYSSISLEPPSRSRSNVGAVRRPSKLSTSSNRFSRDENSRGNSRGSSRGNSRGSSRGNSRGNSRGSKTIGNSNSNETISKNQSILAGLQTNRRHDVRNKYTRENYEPLAKRQKIQKRSHRQSKYRTPPTSRENDSRERSSASIEQNQCVLGELQTPVQSDFGKEPSTENIHYAPIKINITRTDSPLRNTSITGSSFYSGTQNTVVNPSSVDENLKDKDPKETFSTENISKNQCILGGILPMQELVTSNQATEEDIKPREKSQTVGRPRRRTMDNQWRVARGPSGENTSNVESHPSNDGIVINQSNVSEMQTPRKRSTSRESNLIDEPIIVLEATSMSNVIAVSVHQPSKPSTPLLDDETLRAWLNENLSSNEPGAKEQPTFVINDVSKPGSHSHRPSRETSRDRSETSHSSQDRSRIPRAKDCPVAVRPKRILSKDLVPKGKSSKQLSKSLFDSKESTAISQTVHPSVDVTEPSLSTKTPLCVTNDQTPARVSYRSTVDGFKPKPKQPPSVAKNKEVVTIHRSNKPYSSPVHPRKKPPPIPKPANRKPQTPKDDVSSDESFTDSDDSLTDSDFTSDSDDSLERPHPIARPVPVPSRAKARMRPKHTHTISNREFKIMNPAAGPLLYRDSSTKALPSQLRNVSPVNAMDSQTPSLSCRSIGSALAKDSVRSKRVSQIEVRSGREYDYRTENYFSTPRSQSIIGHDIIAPPAPQKVPDICRRKCAVHRQNANPMMHNIRIRSPTPCICRHPVKKPSRVRSNATNMRRRRPVKKNSENYALSYRFRELQQRAPPTRTHDHLRSFLMDLGRSIVPPERYRGTITRKGGDRAAGSGSLIFPFSVRLTDSTTGTSVPAEANRSKGKSGFHLRRK